MKLQAENKNSLDWNAKGVGILFGFSPGFWWNSKLCSSRKQCEGLVQLKANYPGKNGNFLPQEYNYYPGKNGIFFPQEYNYYPGKLAFFSLRNTIICHFSLWILKQIPAFWRCRAQPEPLKVSEKGEIWVKNRNFCASELHLWQGKVSFVWEGSVGRSKLFQILRSSLTISWQFRQDWSKKNSKFSLSCGD